MFFHFSPSKIRCGGLRPLLSYLVEILIVCGFFSSCVKDEKDKSFLRLEALEKGVFRIFKKVGEKYTALSDLNTAYNQDISVKPGQYLIIADCSHRYVSLKKNEHIILKLKTIYFKSPSSLVGKGKLKLTCSQDRKLGF